MVRSIDDEIDSSFALSLSLSPLSGHQRLDGGELNGRPMKATDDEATFVRPPLSHCSLSLSLSTWKWAGEEASR